MKLIAHSLLAGAALGLITSAALTSAALADPDLPQDTSQWFTDAQAAIQARLAYQPNTNRALNVILFIGDGNGVGTNYATRLFEGQQKGMFGEENVLSYEAFPNLALVKTYNINAQTPDSAPTAGAMNTGVKQIFNTINLGENIIHDDCSTVAGNELTTFAEISSGAGKSVGIVTTARLTHATPAAVYAKTANRNWESSAPEGCIDIAMQLFNAMTDGWVDLAMGGGSRYFTPDGFETMDGATGNRPDGRNLIQEAINSGWQYAYDTASADALDLTSSAPVLALFEGSHMKYEYDRTEDDEPSLADMTRMAIEYLGQNPNGFYLEVEAGRIDHANHAGNAFRTLTDGVAFADAVAMADAMTDDADTLIIVTADHEHAIAFNGYCGRGSPINGLCYGVAKGQEMHSDDLLTGSDGKPYTVIGYLNGAGSVLIEQPDGSYFGARPILDEETATDPDFLQQALIPMSSETHSGEDVAVYAKGPYAHLFDGTIEQNYIFHVMYQAAMVAR